MWMFIWRAKSNHHLSAAPARNNDIREESNGDGLWRQAERRAGHCNFCRNEDGSSTQGVPLKRRTPPPLERRDKIPRATLPRTERAKERSRPTALVPSTLLP